MGVGIWSMHFVGMLAFEMPGMEMAYDIPLMLLSVLVAIGASALALYVVSRPTVPMSSLLSGGIAMAAAISGMHYIGMYSMRMAAEIVWDPFLVVLSIVIALVASFAALSISIRLRNAPEKFLQFLLAATIMGFAIAGMHYTGMLAATFVHNDNLVIKDENLLVSMGLTVSVVSTTLLILGLALASSLGQRLLLQRQRRAEDVLNKSEERFRSLLDAVKDYAIFMLDTNGRITTWNRGAERIFGYLAEEVIGRHVSLFYPEPDPDHRITNEEFKKAVDTGHFESDFLRVRRDGSTFWANIVLSPLINPAGEISGYSKVIRDITVLREADLRMRRLNEELEKRVADRTLELQKRESQLRMIANAIPTLVGQLDRDERFLFVNEALASWFNRSIDEMIGSTFREVLGEDRYPFNEPYIKSALKGKITTYERHSQSGERFAVLNITFVPEFDTEGNTIGFILVASDVAKYKEIEAELKHAKRQAEAASETKSAFLANMSHEIRTPLGAVLGFSELIASQEVSESERQNSIEIIKRNGLLLSNIINDILDLSKVEAGKMEVEKIDVPFQEILGELGSLLSLEATAKGIELSVISEGVLPSTINTDPLRLRQILVNIVGNAIKFTEHGSVEVKVKIIPGTAGSRMKLGFIVKDTGTGISAEQSAKLFAPFTQADPTTTRKFGGTGLGLILSKRLANALGGDVMLAESKLGQGSTFVITIDPGEMDKVIFQNNQQPQTQNVVQLPSLKRTVDLSKLNVLVVDDSLDNQALISRFLLLAGAKVETADNGKEGMRKALAGDYSLVLMDLQMPEMDGHTATKMLRAQGYSKPILALTAHAMKEERQRCLESGFNEHLIKPIDRDTLLRSVADFGG